MTPPPPQEHAKRHRSHNEDEVRAEKRECPELEAVRRASIGDEEALQFRDINLAASASSS